MNDLLRRILLVAPLLVLAACGGSQSQRRGELAVLSRLLPGDYDNLEQVRMAGETSGLPALRIVIVPIYAPLVGTDIFYLQEMAADDPRRVTAQRVINLEISADGRLLQGVFLLNEPARWRDGHEKADVFKSLLPTDLRLAEGCDVRWRVSGKAFKGENDPATCRIARPGTGETLHALSRSELDQDGIAFSDAIIDAAGARQPPTDTWLRFRRRVH
jgi:hypothetical protein